MTSYKQVEDAERKLQILLALQRDADYSMNEGLIQRQLEISSFGVGIDRVRTDLTWLQEQGLINLETLAESVMVAKLTQSGQDVALGRSVVPGVARPRPGIYYG